MPGAGYVLVTLPISATEFRVHRIAKTSLGQTGPTGPAGPTGPQGLPGSSTFSAQSANMIFSGPVAGAAAVPTFRSLVSADIPDLSATYLPLTGGMLTGSLQVVGAVVASQYTTQDMGTFAQWTWYADAGMFKLTNTVAVDVFTVSEAGDLSVLGAGLFGGAVTLPGAPTLPLHAATKAYVDAAVVGVVGNQTANTVFAGPTGGAAAAPAFRALVAADIPSLSATYLPLAGGTLTGGLIGTTARMATSVAIGDFTAVPVVEKLQFAVPFATPQGLRISYDADPAYYNSITASINGTAGAHTLLFTFGRGGPTVVPLILDGNGNATVFGALTAASVAATGAITGASSTLTGALAALRVTLGVSVLTYAATTDIDFDLAGFRTLALTGDVTFTTSNRVAGKTASVKILCDATPRTFTFPAWKWMGTAPTGIAANKTGRLSIEAWGANDTDVVAAYAVES